ncbi:hypothetical protein LXL04_015858 [Taraxacum kok-saghyz]
MARYLCTRALSFRWRRRASARVYLHIYSAVVPIDVEKSEKNPGFTFPVPIDVSPYHQRLAKQQQGPICAHCEERRKLMRAFTTSTSWNGEYAEDDYVSIQIDSALDSDDIEDEIDEEVDKVLTSLAVARTADELNKWQDFMTKSTLGQQQMRFMVPVWSGVVRFFHIKFAFLEEDHGGSFDFFRLLFRQLLCRMDTMKMALKKYLLLTKGAGHGIALYKPEEALPMVDG